MEKCTKVTSCITYDDWGDPTMKAILKVGNRELDLVCKEFCSDLVDIRSLNKESLASCKDSSYLLALTS